MSDSAPLTRNGCEGSLGQTPKAKRDVAVLQDVKEHLVGTESYAPLTSSKTAALFLGAFD